MDTTMDSTTLFGQRPPFTQVNRSLALKIMPYLSSRVKQDLALTNKEWYALLRGRTFTLYQGVILGSIDRYLLKTTLTHEDIRSLQKQTGIERVIPPGKPHLIDFKLGEGAFGELRLAVTHKTGAYVALKITKGESVERELIMQQKLSGLPGLLSLVDSAKAKDTLYQMMPLGELDGRKLKKQLDALTDPQFKLEICSHIAYALLQGLAGMHERDAYHLDVKPENLIITARGEALLIDLGCGRLSDSNLGTLSLKEVAGDRRYLAPEVGGLIEKKESNKVFGPQIDGWAVGLTLLELASPHLNLSQEEGETLLNAAILKGDQFFDKLVEKGISQLENPEKGSYWELIKELLSLNPKKRLTPTEALKHPAARLASSDTVAFLCDFASNLELIHQKEAPSLNKVISKKKFLKSKYSMKEMKNSLMSSMRREESLSLGGSSYISPQRLPAPQFASYIERLGPQKELEERLLGSEEGLVAIHGIGGIGKTQLTTRLFHDEKITHHFGTRLWFRNADQSNLLSLQYSALAREWYLVDEKATDEEAIEEIHQKLARDAEKGKPWLIIFDNADTYASLKDYLPRKGGWVIITTRSPGWEEAYPISTLTQEEGLALSVKLLQRKDNHTALCERLENLPLALVQACAYIRNQKLSIEDYLALLDSQPQQLLSEDQQLLGKKLPSAMTAVWNATFSVLKNRHPGALELLNNIAYLANQLPLQILKALSSNKILELLKNYNLLEKQGEIYTIHRLVQEVVRLGHKEKEQTSYLVKGMLVLNAIYQKDPEDLSSRKLNHQLPVHCESLLTIYHEKKLDALKSHVLPMLVCLRQIYGDLGDYHQAISPAQEGIDLAKELFGDFHPEVGTGWNNLGIIWHGLGNAKEAIKHFEKALEIDTVIYDQNHLNIAGDLNNLGCGWESLGDPQKAIQYYEKSLEIKKIIYNRNHPEIAQSLDNLGSAWERLGNPGKALELFKSALDIFKINYGENHPDIARSLNNVGFIMQILGDTKGAINIFESGLKIFENIYNQNHPDIAKNLNNLGEAWNALGNSKKAIDYFERALSINESFYGKQHPHVAISLNNLGSAWNILKEGKKSFDYFQRALEIDLATYDKTHPDIARDLSNLGSSWQVLGNYEKSIEYYEQALRINENIYGKNHPSISRDLSNLGVALKMLGEVKKAIEYYEQALEIDKMIYDANHPLIGSDLNNLGSAWESLEDWEKSIDYLNQALNIFEISHGRYHPDVSACLNNLGTVWESLNDIEKARECYEQSLEIAEAIYQENHPNIAIRLNNLGSIYCTLENMKKSIEYYKKALKIDEDIYGKHHPVVAGDLNNLGLAWINFGDIQKAITNLDRSIAIYNEVYGAIHHETKLAQNNYLRANKILNNLNKMDANYIYFLFSEACVNGDQRLAITILSVDSSKKDIFDVDGNPLIVWMAQNEMNDLIGMVLKLDWNPNVSNKSGIYPLHYAVMKSAELTALFIPYADLFVETPKGSTPAMVAKSKGKMDTLKSLIPSIPGLSLEDASSFDASYEAWKENFIAHPHLLEDRFKAFTLAFHFKDWEFAKKVAKEEMRFFIDQLVRQYPATKKSLLKCIQPFTEACLEGDETLALETLKAFNFEKDLCDVEGNPLICWVAQNTMTFAMEALLNLNWNPNLPNKGGTYPLHYTVIKSPSLTQLLIKAQANPFVVTSKGSTPAIIARNKDKMESLSLILPKIKGLNFESEAAFNASYEDHKAIFISYSDPSPEDILTSLELALHLKDIEFAKLILKDRDASYYVNKLIEQYPLFEGEISVLASELA